MKQQTGCKAGAVSIADMALDDTVNAAKMPQCNSDKDVEEVHSIVQLHQILIVDGLDLPTLTPADIERRVSAFSTLYPKANHTLWSGKRLRDFIGSHFAADVLAAFDMLEAYSYKSDLGRYCLLYASGGLYGDIMLEHYRPWKIPSVYGFAGFRQAWTFRPFTGSVSTSLLWSQPGRDEFLIAIDKIVEYCKTRFYGTDKLEPTGPWLLGRACAAAATDRWRAGKFDDQYMGVHQAATMDDDLVFCTPAPCNETIGCRHALAARPAGDWSKTGLAGTNDYAIMWNERRLYGERA